MQTVNLSSYKLKDDEISLLEKGLSFIPAPRLLPISTIINDKKRLIRSIKLKYFFRDKPPREALSERTPRFVEASDWTPPLRSLPLQALDTIGKLEECCMNTLKAQTRLKNNNKLIRLYECDNLTRSETEGLKNLRNQTNILIKPADKGGATVILDREHYITEALRQLNDENYYVQLERPTHQENVGKIGRVLRKLCDKKLITDEQFQFLSGPTPYKPRTFYLLPKIHKKIDSWTIPGRMPQGRPIVSDVQSESYRISAYIDFFLNPLACKHASYIKNTYDFVDKTRHVVVNRDCFLVTGDVTSLYTNMNIDRTIKIVTETLRDAPADPTRPDAELIELLDITMRNNDFEFDNKFYLQTCGTAMGKIYAPSLANLYLLEFDEKAQNGFRIQPKNYGRYLDDIFFIWDGSKEDLAEFQIFLNSLIPGITITLEEHSKQVNFLDTTIYKKTVNDITSLQTKTFFKDTDTHQLLLKTSHHPRHTTAGILKSQILRFKRLSSTKDDFDNTCKILFAFLKKRGYSFSEMRKSKSSIWFDEGGKKRGNANAPAAANKEILPIINENNRVGIQLTKGYKKAIAEDPFLREFRCLAAYKNPKNLRKSLVRSKLTNPMPLLEPLQEQQERTIDQVLGVRPEAALGFRPCQDARCLACRYHCKAMTKTVVSNVHGESFNIQNSLSCKSSSIIYLITCRKCNMQYVGETNRKLAERLTDHRSNIKNLKATPIGVHFNSANHSFLDIHAVAVEQVDNSGRSTAVRRRREQFWQEKLSTKHPWGLNEMPME